VEISLLSDVFLTEVMMFATIFQELTVSQMAHWVWLIVLRTIPKADKSHNSKEGLFRIRKKVHPR
jgi:hypothetical protein